MEGDARAGAGRIQPGGLGERSIRRGTKQRIALAWLIRSWRRLGGGAAVLALGFGLVVASEAARALEPEDREAVGQAIRAAERGEWRRAFDLVAEVHDPLPLKTLRWLHMIEDGEPADFATLAGFLLANPDWPMPEQLQVIAEGTITDPADHELIRRFFQDCPPLTTRGHIRYAEALFRINQDEQATALIRRAWVEGDFSNGEERKFYLKYRRLLTRQDNIDRLDNLLWDDRRRSAERMLERIPAGYRRLAEARLRLQRRQNGLDKAIAAVPAALQNDPGLLFDRLRWRRQKHLHDAVIELLLDPPAQLVRPARWWFERELQIRQAIRKRDFDLAYRLASSHGQTEGEDFATAEWLAGWLALRFTHQPNTALRHFEQLYDAIEAPVDQARAAYWAGRSAAELGDQALADEWYQKAARHQIAYYGQLAAEELGADWQPPPPPPTASTAQRATFQAKELVHVAEMLIEVGAFDQASPFLLRLAELARNPAEVGLVAELAARSGRPHLIAQVGRYAAYNGQVNEAAAFPIPDIEDMIRPRAGEPEPALLLGVARQESVFNPWLISQAGAQGLLQIMPRTAYLMARSLDEPYNRGLLAGDPDYNLRLGSHYLKTLLARYHSETALAVAAYNAGPRQVDDWIRLHGDPRGNLHAMVDWVELIPFDETRNYVERVLEGRNMYRQRLADRDVATVWFRPVNGPLEPVPAPRLKSLDEAREYIVAALVARAPLPILKPEVGVGGESKLTPSAYNSAPVPELKPHDAWDLAATESIDPTPPHPEAKADPDS
jgi:soluble lytic murein transglycosylase